MRYLSAIALLFASLFGVAIFAGPNARAADGPAATPQTPAPPPPQDQFAATAGSLAQQSAGTWTTTAFVDTGVLCASNVTFYLMTVKPYSYTPSDKPDYVYPSGDSTTLNCDTATYPVTEAMLSFTPSPALPAVPQSASLALTPTGPALAAGEIPVDIPVSVRRQVSTAEYLWIPVGCGLALAALLVVLTMLFGVPKPGGGGTAHRKKDFWGMSLYASAAWSFGDSWATNITALGAVVTGALAATGSIAEVVPGVELGRFGLLVALAGGITLAAPLLFGWLNAHFKADPPPPAHASPPAGDTKDAQNAPPPGEVVAAQMRTLLAASAMTVFGMGAELGIVGWVLGFNLVVAPSWARYSCAALTIAAAVLVLGYGVTAIRALAGTQGGTKGTTLSGARASAFML